MLAAACAGPAQRAAEPAFTHGVASGDMTAESAVLWTRTAAPMRVIPELSLTPGFETPRRLAPASSSAAGDSTVKVLADGLEPGTRYYYRFRAGAETSAVGSFRTAYAAGEHAAVRMAFTGDADWQWKPYPLLASLVQENLDFFLFLGDLIYESLDLEGDRVAEDLAAYRFKYRENREPRPGSPSGMVPMRDLYGAFGQYSIFDNHETGYSGDPNAPRYPEGGARFGAGFVNQTEGHRARLQAYREYQPVREEMLGAAGDARSDGTWRFYRAYSWGANLELIVADDRSYRDARLAGSDDRDAASCARTMLGAVQLRWLEGALLAAKARGAVWKAVVISSPIQDFGGAAEVLTDMNGTKSWMGGYRCERNRLLKFIDDNAIDNVVFLTTDNHYTAVNNLVYDTVADDPRSPKRPARNAFEIVTGPLGAISGPAPYGRAVDIGGLSRRAADRRMVDVWNGDAADANGRILGLRQAHIDPIGLEADFPGLEEASIVSAGGRRGIAEPLAFVSFNSYSYAVLTFDQAHLHVQVKTIENVLDPKTLLDARTLSEYEARRAEETLSFSVRAR